jgi:hypothetical protein
MTDDDLEAERAALLAEGHKLDAEHEDLHNRPDDRPAHAAHRQHLKAHQERLRTYHHNLQQQTEKGPRPLASRDEVRFPTVCPVCQSASIVPGRRMDAYRCLACRTQWIMASSQTEPHA